MQLTHGGGTFPQESVEGTTIYYLKSAEEEAPLYGMSVARGEEYPLGVTVALRAFQVMADGIYFITYLTKAGNAKELRFYDFGTHRSRLIQALGDSRGGLGLAVSPDRKTFLYSVMQGSGANLMVVDNFR